MEVDIKAIAQKLINELDTHQMINKARAEGVALLYERIREATEQSSEPVEQQKEKASPQS